MSGSTTGSAPEEDKGTDTRRETCGCFCVLSRLAAAYTVPTEEQDDAEKNRTSRGVENHSKGRSGGNISGAALWAAGGGPASGLCESGTAGPGGNIDQGGQAHAGADFPAGGEMLAFGCLRLAGRPLHRRRDLPPGRGPCLCRGNPGVGGAGGHRTRRSATYGNYLCLSHADGQETIYAHMQYLYVRAGEVVRAGECLGTAGQTGRATGPHLHFEFLAQGVRQDPAAALPLP